jgi:hypothetical protein
MEVEAANRVTDEFVEALCNASWPSSPPPRLHSAPTT